MILQLWSTSRSCRFWKESWCFGRTSSIWLALQALKSGPLLNAAGACSRLSYAVLCWCCWHVQHLVDLIDVAGSQQDRIKAIKGKTHPLSRSTSFSKAASSGKSALAAPATYSGRYSKQPSTQSLRHSTGSLKATLRQAAQSHAGQKRVLQAPAPSAARVNPAGTLSHSAHVPVVKRAAAMHAERSQAVATSQHMPSRLAADPNAANDLASGTASGSHAMSEAASSPWSSKSPNGQLSALERMLQALPERSTKQAQHEQVSPLHQDSQLHLPC